MVVRTKVYGTKQVQARLKQLSKQYPAAFKTALYREALRIFAVSQQRVPVDTGRLRASGGVAQSSSSPIVVIYYGVVYAGIVHEIHPTKAKFLEGPFLEARAGIAGRIEADMEKIVARGGGSMPSLPAPPPVAPQAPRARDGRGRFL